MHVPCEEERLVEIVIDIDANEVVGRHVEERSWQTVIDHDNLLIMLRAGFRKRWYSKKNNLEEEKRFLTFFSTPKGDTLAKETFQSKYNSGSPACTKQPWKEKAKVKVKRRKTTGMAATILFSTAEASVKPDRSNA